MPKHTSPNFEQYLGQTATPAFCQKYLLFPWFLLQLCYQIMAVFIDAVQSMISTADSFCLIST